MDIDQLIEDIINDSMSSEEFNAKYGINNPTNIYDEAIPIEIMLESELENLYAMKDKPTENIPKKEVINKNVGDSTIKDRLISINVDPNSTLEELDDLLHSYGNKLKKNEENYIQGIEKLEAIAKLPRYSVRRLRNELKKRGYLKRMTRNEVIEAYKQLIRDVAFINSNKYDDMFNKLRSIVADLRYDINPPTSNEPFTIITKQTIRVNRRYLDKLHGFSPVLIGNTTSEVVFMYYHGGGALTDILVKAQLDNILNQVPIDQTSVNMYGIEVDDIDLDTGESKYNLVPITASVIREQKSIKSAMYGYLDPFYKYVGFLITFTKPKTEMPDYYLGYSPYPIIAKDLCISVDDAYKLDLYNKDSDVKDILDTCWLGDGDMPHIFTWSDEHQRYIHRDETPILFQDILTKYPRDKLWNCFFIEVYKEIRDHKPIDAKKAYTFLLKLQNDLKYNNDIFEQLVDTEDKIEQAKLLDKLQVEDKFIEGKFISREIIKHIADKLRLTINIIVTDKPIEVFNEKSKFKSVNLFIQNNHVSKYTPILKPTNVSYVSYSELNTLYSQIHGLKLVHTRQCGYTHEEGIIYDIDAFQHKDTIYKIFRPNEDDNPIYYNCMDQMSYIYKKWKITNNLQPPLNEFHDIWKASTHFITNRRFATIENQMYHQYDMNKAYPSFKSSPYYNQFQLPIGYFNAFNVDTNDTLSIISKTGTSFIVNLQYNNDFIKDNQFIQDKNWYPNPLLYYMMINKYATFDITQTLVAEKGDIDFPFKPFNSTNPSDKAFNVNFIGRLIAGNKDTVTRTYLSDTEVDHQILCYYFEKQKNDKTILSYSPLQLSPMRPYKYAIDVTMPKTSTNQLYHLASYIYAYQQITFIEAMVKAVEHTHIVHYNVDGFSTISPIPDFTTSSEPHQFKYEYKMIKGCFKTEPTIHTSCQEFSFPYLSVYEGRLNKYTFTIGPAGSQKTKTFFENPMISCALTTPTHLLKHNHINWLLSINNEMPVYTAHKAFGIGTDYSQIKVPIYNTYIVDETTMFDKVIISKILDFANKHKCNIYFVGDYEPIYGSQQLCPSVGEEIDDYFISQNLITIYRQPLTKQRRQISIEDQEFCDKLRYKTFSEQLELIKSNNKIQFITQKEMLDRFTISEDEHDIGISCLNETCFLYNKSLYEKCDYMQVKVLKNKAPLVKGQIIYKPKAEFDMKDVCFIRKSDEIAKASKKYTYYMAYFATCHAVQGITHKGKIYIDLKKGESMKNSLYTAITRCTDLCNIFIIV